MAAAKLILRRIFHDALAIIATDREDCEEVGDALRTMSNVANLCHRFSNSIIGLHSVAVVFYGIGVVALRSQTTDGVDERELFLKMELPFESGTSPVYELVMTAQFLHQMTSATVIGVLSALLVTLVSWDLRGSLLPSRRGILKFPTEISSGNGSPEVAWSTFSLKWLKLCSAHVRNLFKKNRKRISREIDSELTR